MAKAIKAVTRKPRSPNVVKHQFKPGQPSPNPSGRPKGAHRGGLNEAQRQELAKRMGITPLEFLMSILRDERASLRAKVDAAKSAAPYMHRKMPIAIEGGDSEKPIRLEAGAFSKLSKEELLVLRSILAKAGLADPSPTIPTVANALGQVAYAAHEEDDKA